MELHFRHADVTAQVEQPPAKYRQFAEDGPNISGHITRCNPPRVLSYTNGGSRPK